MLSVPLPSDGAGYVGFECPACDRYFKLLASGLLEDTKQVYCVYCGHHDQAQAFLTADEIEQVKKIGVAHVTEQVHKDLEEMLLDAFRGSKNVKVTRGSRQRPAPPDRPLERDLPNEHLCARCALRFGHEGNARFCPQCYAPLNSTET